MADTRQLMIGERAGFTTRIGDLVGMMEYVRSTTLQAVDGLSIAELDHLADAESDSIMWFHVFEDELNHRGQIRWLRKPLPTRR